MRKNICKRIARKISIGDELRDEPSMVGAFNGVIKATKIRIIHTWYAADDDGRGAELIKKRNGALIENDAIWKMAFKVSKSLLLSFKTDGGRW